MALKTRWKYETLAAWGVWADLFPFIKSSREDQVRDMLGDTLRYRQSNQIIENGATLRRLR